MPAELPLAVEIGLDVLAAWLNRRPGPALVVADSPPLRAAALLRIDRVEHETDRPDDRVAPRVLWLGAGDPPWRLTAAGGCLGALVPGPVAWLFDRRRGDPPRRAAGARPPAGFRLEARAGIGGPATALYAVMAQAAERAGRGDLADRFAFAHRRSLAPRPSTRLAELIVLLARRG
ncbi:MAG TPA: hypothetical protein VG370_09810 [Chloroflexota bacterium]|nr:hypothetical protein [Chloroflexota bacterium]